MSRKQAERPGIGKRLHHLKRRLVLLRPKRVDFRVDGRPFRVYGTWSANRGLGHDFARNGCHEPVLSRLLIETLETTGREAVYWDVGSALGYFMAIAGRLVEPANVHAFEPGPNFAWLQANNRRLFGGRVNINQVFVSDTSRPDGTRVSLDDYAAREGDPDAVKIDVDGGEAEVLAGAGQVLRRARPVLFLEVHFLGGPPYAELRERLIGLLDGMPYNFQVCRNHRRMDGTLEKLASLDELPENRDESFDDNDYLLIGRPA